MALIALFGLVASDPSSARRRQQAPARATAQQPAAATPALPDAASPAAAAAAERAGPVQSAQPSAAEPTPAAGPPLPVRTELPEPTTTALRLPIAEPPGVDADAGNRAATPVQQGQAGSSSGSPQSSTAQASATPPLKLPPPPQDPAAAKAFAVLASNCASCHQRGAGGSGSASPAGEFGDVLDLDRLAREPGLVQPGNPDGSRLYQLMYARHAPQEVLNTRDGLSVGEVEAVRDWIAGLPASTTRMCPDRQRIDGAELNGIVRRWLETAGADAARSTRFVSLAHLHNACASDAELAAYRQAIQKLLNSLSWTEAPARIETVGDALVLLAFRLSDIGWVPAHWERLANAEPQGGAVPTPEALKAVSGSPHPVIRGDWLASVASRGQLYYELLGFPEKLPDLARLIGLDLALDARTHKLARAGLKSSAETHAPRLVERHLGRDGHALWIAHDWPSSVPAQEVFDNPMGAQASASKPAENTRVILTLPNGLSAFASFDAAGARRLDAQMPAGRTCMGCHGVGALPFADEARAHISSDKFGGPREVKDAALPSYPAAAELARMFEEDGYRSRRALIQAGVDPDLTLEGLEIVAALARTYERPVGIDRLSAETGLPAPEVGQRLEQVGGEAQNLAQRVRQGVLPRRDAERLLLALKEAGPQSVSGSSSISTGSVAGGEPLELALWSDKTSYASGATMTLSAQASRNCFLTLIDIDAAGKATVLFPNEFEPDNLVAAGSTLRVPGPKSPYQLRLKDKGRETTVAICNTAQKIPVGIDIDYERQRFTMLGLWTNFLNEAQGLEAEYRRNPERARAQAAARAHANAMALAKGKAAADDAAAAARARLESSAGDLEARTAIQFKVE